MSRPPRIPGGGGASGGRPPGNRPPGNRPTGGKPTGTRPPSPFNERPPRSTDARAPDARRSRDSGEAIATSVRELRQHIPGGRPVRLPRGGMPTGEPTIPAGRRGRGERRAAEARAPGAGAIEPQRIAKLLARAGVGSRRDIERMITEGRIAVHGKVLESPAFILSSLDGVTVNGDPVASIEATRLFAFNKPAGFLTTARDPAGRPTIFDVLPPGLPRLVPVGRLDMNTEGLLLMTTDGALKRQLELPINAVSRRYRVRAYGDISVATLDALIDGITIDGMHYGPIDADIEIRTGRNLWISMRLTEGKNREIRRVLEFLGLQVSRLIRVAYGPFELGDLPVRGVAEIDSDAIVRLKKSFGKARD
ncbi:MAG TPA: pseudouridine synthase [Polymorphobacter sp.]|nr:pseudouridine synthase [Polymorphobacter sp.]